MGDGHDQDFIAADLVNNSIGEAPCPFRIDGVWENTVRSKKRQNNIR